ncbi:conserved hypothetical protein (plasmid) [Rhodoferax ferrireducens T118]|uniref:Uncharacterized protein n=1 Tax=Albidiferax ferrireducens (strain ATCC BAA-621 / DSM 15236 / T118) TaxID=338969 RepID=Q21Q68_ALBFT|nr:conserved hypothetical protein [Rhodoferax ferrireducens T118]
MEDLTRRRLLELMVGVGCVTPMETMAATWKQVSANAGGGQTWKPIPYTGPAGTNWKKLGAAGAVTINLVISANVYAYNIKNEALATGWNGTTPAICTVTINSGVVVGSVSYLTHSFDTGPGWPLGSTISIVNGGYIAGKGGDGGTGGDSAMNTGLSGGSPGGPAMNLQWPVTITNAAGYIYSGGGGGGGGMGSPDIGSGGHGGAGGCGGAGFGYGAGGWYGYDDWLGGLTRRGGQVAGGGLLNGGGGAGLGVTGNWNGGGGGGASGGPADSWPGGHGLAITTNGHAITWASGNTRVYGGVV